MADDLEREDETTEAREAGRPDEASDGAPDAAASQPADAAAAPPRPPYQVRHSRRRFLVLGGILVAGLVGVLEGLRHLVGGDSAGPGAVQSATNRFSSFPLNAVERVPDKTWSEWTVRVDGLVDKPLTLDAAAWRALPRFQETVEFRCVEGWTVDNLKWGGVTPATILKQAQARPEGAYVIFHAYTGEYMDSLPIGQVMDPQTVLADTLDGVPLPAEHGGPLRLVVPKQLGYKSVKWVTRIEVADKPVVGYWENYGYPSDAPATP